MVYITQLIYLKPGEHEAFEAFESVAIAAIEKYNGKMLLRMKTSPEQIIQSDMERPDEIHLAMFPTHQDFEDFKKDKDRQHALYLKEKSVRSVMMIEGEAR